MSHIESFICFFYFCQNPYGNVTQLLISYRFFVFVFLIDLHRFLLTSVASCKFLWISIDSSGSAGFQFAPTIYVLRQTNELFFIVSVADNPYNPFLSFILPCYLLFYLILSYSIWYMYYVSLS